MTNRVLGQFRNVDGGPPRPYFNTTVVLPDGTVGPVSFLLDTGASQTTLHPIDWEKMGLPIFTPYPASDRWMTGVGGQVAYRPIEVSLVFRAGSEAFELPIEVLYGPSGPVDDDGRKLPSLLGMDILAHGVLQMDHSSKNLSFEPNGSDALKAQRDMRELLRSPAPSP